MHLTSCTVVAIWPQKKTKSKDDRMQINKWKKKKKTNWFYFFKIYIK